MVEVDVDPCEEDWKSCHSLMVLACAGAVHRGQPVDSGRTCLWDVDLLGITLHESVGVALVS